MISFMILISLVVNRGIANAQTVGQHIQAANNYSGIIIGNINIMLTVPHDGNLIVNGWPNRTDEGGNPLRDVYTLDFALAVSNKFTQLYQQKFNTKNQVSPFIVFNNLHRLYHS
jgi:hypothetical protein